MKLQPLGDYVLLEQFEPEETTSGGIILPENAKQRPDEGKVVALAADASDEIEIGDRVIYKKFSGEEIRIDGKPHRLVQAADILAKYVEADEIPE
ncbi:MAG: co-chaperone GroES [Polyangia bacterium]